MVRPSDDGCYIVRCDLGHEAQVYVSNLKFELLFDMGVHAMYDGYPREAVSCFASTLERFYEFLQAVESQVRLTRIDNITITPVNQFSRLFTIEMQMSIFHDAL